MNKKELGIIIPPEQISKEALNNIVESFVLREGTDYGVNEVSFEKKIAQVLSQINAGIVLLTFDPETASVNLIRAEEGSKPFSEDILDAPDTEMVCYCCQITKGEIIKAKASGVKSLSGIKQMTGACTRGDCKTLSPRKRCCSKEIERLLYS